MKFDVERFDDLSERLMAHSKLALRSRYARAAVAEEFAAAGAGPEIVFMVTDWTGEVRGMFANLDEVESFTVAREREPERDMTILFPELREIAAPFGIAVLARSPKSAALFKQLDVDDSAEFIAANDTTLLAAESRYKAFVIAVGKLIRRERVRRWRAASAKAAAALHS